jgi:pilus assembly protein TadC
VSALGWLALALFLVPAGASGALARADGRAAGAPARHRVPASGAGRSAGLPLRRQVALPVIAAVAAAVLLVLFLGSWPGAALAPLAAAAGWLVTSRLQAATTHPPPEPRAVALVVDLLAGALAAGSPPDVAIDRVAAAVTAHGTPALRHAVEPLGRVGRLLQLGSEPATAWAELDTVPGYRTVADCGRRCAGSGARLAQALAAVAVELRAVHQAEALSKAERVGVWSLLPLGLCFLPAFVCLGVLPVILGVAGEVFAGISG